MSERFVAIPRRTLALAEKLRRTQRTVQRVGPRQFETVAFPAYAFAGCVPVVLDAVSDWWDSLGAHEWPDPRLAETFRMPWPAVWAEWEDRGVTTPGMNGRPMRRGLLIRDYPAKSELSPTQMLRWLRCGIATEARAHIDAVCEGYAGINHMLLLEELPNGEVMSSRYLAVPYDAHGRRFETAEGVIMHGDPNAYGESRPARDHTYGNSAVWRLFVALLNVKNIDAVDVDLQRAERRRMERLAVADKGPPPWIKYKTLAISLPSQPMEEGNKRSGGPASAIPFHIVRGHLADYTKGKGLFGKYRTVVWMPMHSRGFQRAGAVAKTYEARMAPNADLFAARQK